MCGIAGIVAFTDNGRLSLSGIGNAVEAMHSRGPDSKGFYNHENIALGHVRLSIIDTSDAASQPFTDASGRYTIIFNGEFYNFKQYLPLLAQKGISLRSTSDTEVLLYLYIIEGAKCLNKINGFFAFAVYDKLEKTLFIARDRMGIKPLLIYRDEDKLMFASEMKALLAMGIPRELDYTSLFTYLQMNIIPAQRSIFNKVEKLEPGKFMFIKGDSVKEETYYQIPYDPETAHNNSVTYNEAGNKIVDLLRESVSKRMISDVPLGAFLSGGIDSSVIVALASEQSKHLNTFSIGYKDEPYFDETRYAQIVADKYKTNHTVFSLTNDDLFSVLFNVLEYIDEPFADSSALAVYILSRHTRQKVTVALSGDGADELFGGYMKHSAEYRIRNSGASGGLLKMAAPLLKMLPQSRNSAFTNKFRQLSKYADGLSMNMQERYWRWCSYIDEKQASDMLIPAYNKKEYYRRKALITEPIGNELIMNNMLMADMKHVLLNDMLPKVDLMSMANSLEVRVPFLDYQLVDYVFSLPSSFKVDSKVRKKILQDAFRDLLPEEIYHRPKHGFEVPLLKWFRKELFGLINDDMLSDEFIISQNIFNVSETKKIKQRLQSNNPGDVHAQLWSLIVFQYWWKKYMAV